MINIGALIFAFLSFVEMWGPGWETRWTTNPEACWTSMVPNGVVELQGRCGSSALRSVATYNPNMPITVEAPLWGAPDTGGYYSAIGITATGSACSWILIGTTNLPQYTGGPDAIVIHKGCQQPSIISFVPGPGYVAKVRLEYIAGLGLRYFVNDVPISMISWAPVGITRVYHHCQGRCGVRDFLVEGTVVE